LVKPSLVFLALYIAETLLVSTFLVESTYLRDRPEYSSRDWVAVWGGSGREYARSLACSEGCLFVTGDTTSYGPGEENVFLLKYSGDGQLIWNRTWGGDGFSMGRAMVASGGTLYICGIRSNENESNALLLKYDDDGALIWSREWRGRTDAIGRGVAVDSSGSIYITGYTRGNESKTWSFLLKYKPDGSLIWARELNESDTETGWAVSVDDGIYLSCTTLRTETQSVSLGALPRTRMMLRKFDFDGNLLWARSWGTGLENFGLAVTSSKDRIFQAGFARLINGTAKFALLEYTSNGDLLHAHLFGDSFESYAWSVVVTGPYVYVVGHEMSPSFMDAKDAYVAKLGAEGNMLWARTWGGFGDDIARSVAVEGDHVYVTGITYGVGEGGQVFLLAYTSPNPSVEPGFVIKLASLGVGIALLIFVAYEGIRRNALRKAPDQKDVK